MPSLKPSFYFPLPPTLKGIENISGKTHLAFHFHKNKKCCLLVASGVGEGKRRNGREKPHTSNLILLLILVLGFFIYCIYRSLTSGTV
jgi:hypothetical protein